MMIKFNFVAAFAMGLMFTSIGRAELVEVAARQDIVVASGATSIDLSLFCGIEIESKNYERKINKNSQFLLDINAKKVSDLPEKERLELLKSIVSFGRFGFIKDREFTEEMFLKTFERMYGKKMSSVEEFDEILIYFLFSTKTNTKYRVLCAKPTTGQLSSDYLLEEIQSKFIVEIER